MHFLVLFDPSGHCCKVWLCMYVPFGSRDLMDAPVPLGPTTSLMPRLAPRLRSSVTVFSPLVPPSLAPARALAPALALAPARALAPALAPAVSGGNTSA